MSKAAPENKTAPAPTGGQPSVHGGNYGVVRPGGVCLTCGRPIEPDEKFMAALRETPTGFERIDLHFPCWEQFDHKDLIGFWRTVMPRHEAKKKRFVDDEVLCELFGRLGETTDAGKLNFRFVLGLILMRKRMLIYESTRREEQREVWRVRLKGREEVLDLLNPQLTEEQVMDVSRQLGEILNEEL